MNQAGKAGGSGKYLKTDFGMQGGRVLCEVKKPFTNFFISTRAKSSSISPGSLDKEKKHSDSYTQISKWKQQD